MKRNRILILFVLIAISVSCTNTSADTHFRNAVDSAIAPGIMVYTSKTKQYKKVLLNKSLPVIPVTQQSFDTIVTLIRQHGDTVKYLETEGKLVYDFVDSHNIHNHIVIITGPHSSTRANYIMCSTDVGKGSEKNIQYQIHRDKAYPVFAYDSDFVRQYAIVKTAYQSLLSKTNLILKH